MLRPKSPLLTDEQVFIPRPLASIDGAWDLRSPALRVAYRQRITLPPQALPTNRSRPTASGAKRPFSAATSCILGVLIFAPKSPETRFGCISGCTSAGRAPVRHVGASSGERDGASSGAVAPAPGLVGFFTRILFHSAKKNPAYSLRQVAFRFGVTQPIFSRVERGRGCVTW